VYCNFIHGVVGRDPSLEEILDYMDANTGATSRSILADVNIDQAQVASLPQAHLPSESQTGLGHDRQVGSDHVRQETSSLLSEGATGGEYGEPLGAVGGTTPKRVDTGTSYLIITDIFDQISDFSYM